MSKLSLSVQKMAQTAALVTAPDWELALAAVGGDVARLDSLDRVAAYVARYGRSHEDRIAATKAKLKIARQGGKAIIEGQADNSIASQGRPSKTSRETTLSGLGLTRDRSSRWQAIAKMPEDDYESRLFAIEHEGEDDSLAVQAMGGLKASGIVEWYTPLRYIEAAHEVMGGIDLDPASSVLANRTVGASHIFTVDDDGLEQDWSGRVWLNPPYGKGSGLFTSKLVAEYGAGHVTAAVLLLNAYGFDSDWFRPLWGHPICFTDHRVAFTSPQRESGGPANGNIFVYLGGDDRRFAERFAEFGVVVRQWP